MMQSFRLAAVVFALYMTFCSPLDPQNVVEGEERPNIIWIFAEDTSPWMGCYGDSVNEGKTPNIDAIARDGVRFANAFVPAPVCSACRSAMMNGQNQIRFGAHEHRSSRGKRKINLPDGRKLLPELMQESGYYTFNYGKTDYNFVWDQSKTYSELKKRPVTDWKKLKKNQPFFGQIQTRGGKNNTKNFPKNRRANPEEVTVPPDYPQNQLYKEVVAQHYDAIRVDDDFIGGLLKGLKGAGLAENTIVVYFSDHGANRLLRHKQMVTEGGLHVPFAITGPKKFVPQSQKVRKDLVNMLDLSATTLAWAGLEIPDWYEGQNLFASDFQGRDQVYSAKDRLDSTIDRCRTVRTKRFRYTRNFKLDRIFLQPQYRDPQDFTKNLRELYASGKLSPKLKEIYFGERPAEEFYDVTTDPSQINNLVNDPEFKTELQRHRKLLDQWLAKGDMGQGEEPIEEMRYNAEQPKWGLGVNPEYEVYRPDTDGDGLSDIWESINKRDPKDGRLLFEFDCGGWQTEGWKADDGIESNIAGFLGYLDFDLATTGALQRTGLSVQANDSDQALAIKLRSTQGLTLQLRVNGKKLGGPVEVGASKEYQMFKVALSDQEEWRGKIESIQWTFEKAESSEKASIEIDSIQVLR